MSARVAKKRSSDLREFLVPRSRVPARYCAQHLHGTRTGLRGSIKTYFGKFATEPRAEDEQQAALEAACEKALDDEGDVVQLVQLGVTDAYGRHFGLRTVEDPVLLERVTLNEPFYLLPCGHVLKAETLAPYMARFSTCPSCRSALPPRETLVPVRMPYDAGLRELLEEFEAADAADAWNGMSEE